MSTEATLTSKGQTTIPKEIRDSLHMKEGDRMTFTLLPDGTVLMRVKNRSAMEVAGRLHKIRSKSLADRRSIPVMIGLDTNVLVRFLVRDDEEQFECARKLIRRQAQDGQRVRISPLGVARGGLRVCEATATFDSDALKLPTFIAG